MLKEYNTIREIVGPLALVEGVEQPLGTVGKPRRVSGSDFDGNGLGTTGSQQQQGSHCTDNG